MTETVFYTHHATNLDNKESAFSDLWYDQESRSLAIDVNGRVYIYTPVSFSLYLDFADAGSWGKFYNTYVSGHLPRDKESGRSTLDYNFVQRFPKQEVVKQGETETTTEVTLEVDAKVVIVCKGNVDADVVLKEFIKQFNIEDENSVFVLSRSVTTTEKF